MKTHHTENPAIDPIIHLWLLRILMKLGGRRKFISSHGFNNDTLAEILGLGQWINSSWDEHDRKAGKPFRQSCANHSSKLKRNGHDCCHQPACVSTSVNCPDW